jgi:hypothetical protein
MFLFRISRTPLWETARLETLTALMAKPLL